MIDLHTHLLPDWDDGPGDWEEVFQICRVASEDGIKKIVLTPHLFRVSKYNDDLNVLDERFSEFLVQTEEVDIEFYRGAEVFVQHNLVETIKRHDLSVHSSNYLFIEFSSDSIVPGVKDLFYSIMLEGFIPIISHPERNSVFQERPDLLFTLIEMGSLAQVTAMSLTGKFGQRTRKTAELFLKNNLVHIIASDAHDSERRPPKLSRGVAAAGKIVGREKAEAMVTVIPQAILDNETIPDFGEPINPVRKKKWMIRVPGRGRR